MSVLSSACIFAIEKNTIHSIDIEVFRCNNTKKHFDCPSGSIMKHLREFVTSVPEYRRTGKAISSINLKTYLCLSYWAGSVSALPKPRYSSLANVILYG